MVASHGVKLSCAVYEAHERATRLLIRRGVVELAEKEKDLHVIYDPDGLFEGRDEVV